MDCDDRRINTAGDDASGKTQNAINVLKIITSTPRTAYAVPLVRRTLLVIVLMVVTRSVVNVQKIIMSLPTNAKNVPLVRRMLLVILLRMEIRHATAILCSANQYVSSNECRILSSWYDECCR